MAPRWYCSLTCRGLFVSVSLIGAIPVFFAWNYHKLSQVIVKTVMNQSVHITLFYNPQLETFNALTKKFNKSRAAIKT